MQQPYRHVPCSSTLRPLIPATTPIEPPPPRAWPNGETALNRKPLWRPDMQRRESITRTCISEQQGWGRRANVYLTSPRRRRRRRAGGGLWNGTSIGTSLHLLSDGGVRMLDVSLHLARTPQRSDMASERVILPPIRASRTEVRGGTTRHHC